MDDEPDALAATLDSALAQTWPSIEVLVVDESAGGLVQDTIGRYADRVEARSFPSSGRSAARTGLEAGNGSFVALLDSGAQFDETAVETGLALPHLSRFQRAPCRDPGSSASAARSQPQRGFSGGRPRTRRSCSPRASCLTPQAVDARALAAVRRKRPDRDTRGRSRRSIESTSFEVEGASYLAFMLETFGWLADRPLLDEHLRQDLPQRARERARPRARARLRPGA